MRTLWILGVVFSALLIVSSIVLWIVAIWEGNADLAGRIGQTGVILFFTGAISGTIFGGGLANSYI